MIYAEWTLYGEFENGFLFHLGRIPRRHIQPGY